MNENAVKTAIMDATKKVVYEKKISGTSIRSIAKEAGVLSSHIQYYYATKHNLLDSLLIKTFQQLIDDRNARLGDCDASLAGKLGAIIGLKKSNLKNKTTESILFDFWIQSLIDDTFNKRYRDAYDSWRDDIRKILYEFHPDLDPEQAENLSYAMVSIMQGATLQYYINDSFDLEKYFSFCMDMMLSTLKSKQDE